MPTPQSPQAVPATAAARGRIAPARLAHIVFRTARKDELVAWYRNVFEAEESLANPFLTFLTFDDEHHRIAIAGMPGLEPKGERSVGMEHCAFTYASLGDLLATYTRLRDAGITPYWCINHGPNLSCYYRDPDGNQVELTIDVFDGTQAVNDWYATSDFAANPIGVLFDPDDLVRRFADGEPLASLTQRPVIPAEQVMGQLPRG